MSRLQLFIFIFLIFTSFSFAEEVSSPCGEVDGCKIGVKTLVYFDKSRERLIITEIYYPPERGDPNLIPTSSNFKLLQEERNAPIPNREGKLPLIILSHGYQGSRYDLSWLQEVLAANGYIVAVPDHFGDTRYMHRAEDSLKRWDRPKDVSFVIDQLLEDPLFKEHIDPDKIGFIGYSHGGLTGIWLAGGIAQNYPTPEINSSSFIELDDGVSEKIIKSINFSKATKSYEDKRVKAEFLMAPSYGFAFSPAGLSTIEIPITIVGTKGDSVTPISRNAQFYADHIKSSALKVLSGKEGHYVFLNRAEEDRQQLLPSYLTKDDSSVDRVKVHEEIATMALNFFDKYLKDKKSNENKQATQP